MFAPMLIRAEIWLSSVQVLINGTLHLMFRRSAFLGLQSWTDEKCSTIEITLSGGAVIEATYENRETWVAVLTELAKLDITAV